MSPDIGGDRRPRPGATPAAVDRRVHRRGPKPRSVARRRTRDRPLEAVRHLTDGVIRLDTTAEGMWATRPEVVSSAIVFGESAQDPCWVGPRTESARLRAVLERQLPSRFQADHVLTVRRFNAEAGQERHSAGTSANDVAKRTPHRYGVRGVARSEVSPRGAPS